MPDKRSLMSTEPFGWWVIIWSISCWIIILFAIVAISNCLHILCFEQYPDILQTSIPFSLYTRRNIRTTCQRFLLLSLPLLLSSRFTTSSAYSLKVHILLLSQSQRLSSPEAWVESANLHCSPPPPPNIYLPIVCCPGKHKTAFLSLVLSAQIYCSLLKILYRPEFWLRLWVTNCHGFSHVTCAAHINV